MASETGVLHMPPGKNLSYLLRGAVAFGEILLTGKMFSSR